MITLALVGVGKWGENYLKTIQKIKNGRIKYLVAQSEPALSKFSDEYTKLTDYKDLFNYADIDGVIIATPGSTHYKIIRNFMERDWHILVEKPMTTSLAEALSLSQMAKFKKAKVFVGHIYLYNPAYQLLKRLVKTLGDIRYIKFQADNFGPFRDDMSILWEWAPHGLSICLDLLDNLPEDVSCWVIETLRPGRQLYDSAYMKLKFGKMICILEFNWLYPVRKRELTICGSKSTLVFDDQKEKKLTLFKNLGPVVLDNKIIGQNVSISHPGYQKTAPLEVELQAFINFIKRGERPKTDLDQAIKIAGIIEMAEKSLKNNGQPSKVIIDTN